MNKKIEYTVEITTEDSLSPEGKKIIKNNLGKPLAVQRFSVLTYEIVQELSSLPGSPRDIKYVLAEMSAALPGVEISVNWVNDQGDLGEGYFRSKSETEIKNELENLGYYLENGVGYIDESAAKSFLKSRYYITLNEAISISDDAAKILSKSRRDLDLESLEEVSDVAIEYLSRHKGDSLNIGGLTMLSQNSARSLAKHKGELRLDSLPTLSVAAAELLSKHEGAVHLNGLKELSADAARFLKANKEIVTPLDLGAIASGKTPKQKKRGRC
jgi:hypothetical protein